MSTSSKKFCTPEDIKNRNSETTNEKDEMKKYEKRILQCVLAEKIIPIDLKHWPFFHVLKPEFIRQIHMIKIYVKIVCGYNHTLALTNKGEVYAWGVNFHGQVGVNNNRTSSDPILVNVPQMGKVLNVDACRNVSVAVGYDRTVYVWGSYFCQNITQPFPTKFSRIFDVFAHNKTFEDKPLIVHDSLHTVRITNNNNYKYIEEILESLGAAFDDPLTSDFIIQVEGQPIYVHKVIINIRSQHFRNMFHHDWAEDVQSTSDTLPELKEFCFQFALRHMIVNTLSEDYIELDMSTQAKFIHRSAIQNDVTITSSTFYSSNKNVAKRNLETTIKKNEMQKYEKRILQCVLAEKIIPINLKSWPFFHVLKPEFIPQIHMVMQFMTSPNCSNGFIIVTKDKNVYNFDYKEEHLKFGDLHTALYLKEIKELCGKNIKTFACSGSFILILTEEGEVYFCKIAEKDLFRSSFTIPDVSTFIRIAGLSDKRIVDIDCGEDHGLALTCDGEVYAWNEYCCEHYDWEESDCISDSVYTVSDKFSYVVYKAFLKYLYFGTIDLPSENAFELMELADMYCGTNLVKDCSQIIKKIISVSNVAFFYNKAIECNAKTGNVRIASYAKKIKELCGKNIQTFAHNRDFVLALTEEGELYIYKFTKKKRRGSYLEQSDVPTFTRITGLKDKRIVDIACGSYHFLALTSSGKVYAWEDVIYMQQGNENTAIFDGSVRQIKHGLEKKNVVYIACGHKFNMVITDENKLYGWGKNDKFRISPDFYRTQEEYYTKYPHEITTFSDKIELMELADMYCETNLKEDCNQIIKQTITVSNVAFFYNKAIEYNAKELEEFCLQFAFRHMTLSKDYNKLDMSILAKCTQRAAIDNDAIITSSTFCSLNKNVKNRNLETSTKKYEMLKCEKRILQCLLAEKLTSMDLKRWPFFHLLKSEFISEIHMIMRYIKIVCGRAHVLALTNKGEVYAWGDNRRGQVRVNKNRISGPTVVNVPEMGKVLDIAACDDYSVAVGYDKIIYLWGSYYWNKITIPFPTKFSNIHDVFAHNICSHYLIVLTNNFKYVKEVLNILESLKAIFDDPVYTWENNISMQDDNENTVIFDGSVRQVKHGLEKKNVVHIACGFKFNMIITDKNKLYGWGTNKRGRISFDQTQKYYKYPRKITTFSDKIVKMACGYQHTLALTNKGDIYAWENISYEQDVNNLKFSNPTVLTSDLTIQVEGRPIYVHKAILKIRCQYFKNMFQHDWIENIQSISDSVYTVSEKFSYVVYKAFLKYLYSGIIDLPLENTLELMELANVYCETNLKKDCSQIIKQTITVSNVKFLYNKAMAYNAKELEEFCFHFAVHHIKAVVLSEEYIKLDTSTKDNFMRRAKTKYFRNMILLT
ncbi:RCC1 and BTB domain-containing protein 1 [Camponotus floridanus]|uniref:RCC1 and BTB domain-containing protein 1 n=1 Tax=Camponotus floridanus TaxID=104421 RepID=E2A4G4_CAMFO|nr:RCC1 and BTB domain-containing protein 1 [Camponotus floridanus]